jgi:hypothetical protein
MKRKSLMVIALLWTVAAPAPGQFTGYCSATRGYHANPLYNFERIGDQITQTYTELGYTESTPSSMLKVNYVSGLMLFNAFTDRNYYEHTLTGTYGFSLDEPPGISPERERAGAEGSEEEETEERAEANYGESVYPALDLTLKIGARHDKGSFREFDNVGGDAGGAYRMLLGEDVALSVTNTFGYRRYIYLSPLSNITDQLTVEFGIPAGRPLRYGLRSITGLKHFTETIYDTARFETVRTFVLKPAGRGKGGAKIKVPSDKQLLLNPETENIVQLTIGAFGEWKLGGGSLGVEILYRRNPGRPTRYLAQYANTTMLNEDIYNDHFSFEGPDVSVTLRHALPLSIQAIVTTGYQRKLFGAPALNLLGVQSAPNRIDHRTSLEFYLSKYFELTDGLGLDLALSGTVMRNQSNDDYNDYALIQTGISAGVGF